MNAGYVDSSALDAIPDAPNEAWAEAREAVARHAPDLAAMILGDDDHRIASGAMRGTRDRRRAIARLERTKGSTS